MIGIELVLYAVQMEARDLKDLKLGVLLVDHEWYSGKQAAYKVTFGLLQTS